MNASHGNRTAAPRDAGADQAAGLRDLLRRRTLRLLPVLGETDAAAQGACAAELASALAQGGRSVILVDATGEALRALQLTPRLDLMDMLDGSQEFSQVALGAGTGLKVLAAQRGLPALIQAGAATEEFFGGFLRLSDPADMLVLNLDRTAGPDGRLWLPYLGASVEALMVMAPGERALTAAYSMIKQACLAQDQLPAPMPSFRVLVNGGAGERDARSTCRLLSDTARRFLGAAVTYAGNLPRDPRGRAFSAAAGTRRHAEGMRALKRLADEVQGWRLAECMQAAADEGYAH